MVRKSFIFFTGLFFLAIAMANVSAISDYIELDGYIVDYSYNDAESGEKFTLKIDITNTEEKKENINIDFDEDSPFEFIGDSDWEIDSLEKDETITKNFRVEIEDDCKSGDYEIDFDLEDNFEDYEDSVKIEVKLNAVEFIVGNIQSDPNTLFPDMKDIKLFVDLQNTGEKDAKYIKAKLKLPDGFVASNSYSDISNIGILKAGETKQLIFYLDTLDFLKPDLYESQINLEYQDDYSKKEESLDIELPVYGIPQFDIVSFTTNPSKIMEKDCVSLKLKIMNIGQKDAKDTSIKVFEKSEHPFEFEEKTYYIGTLSPNQTGVAVLNFNVKKSALPNDYLTNIQIRTVHEGNVLISEESISIKVWEFERNIENILKFMVWGIFIIPIGVIGFYRIRKKRIKF